MAWQNPDTGRTEPCAYCNEPFASQDEWDWRHSDSEGRDVHEECCDVCHGDDRQHRE